jgi:peptidoglycan/LPS O-acetylase OafA/YrhL
VALLCLVLNQDAPVHETKFLLEVAAIAGALFTFSPHGFEPYFNPPLWSLGVEIWFSILFPVIVLGLKRLGAVRLLMLALAIGWVSRYLGNVLPASGSTLGVQPLTIGLPASLEIFIAGMVLAELYATRPHGAPLVARPGLAFLSGVLLVATAISLQQISHAALAVPILFPDILTLGFALIAASLLAMPAGALKSVFANRPIQVLGMMCFSLYVWHEPLLRHVFKADMAPLDGLGRSLLVYLGLLLAVGGLSYRFIEFGRVADWRALFLIERKRKAPAVPAPVAAVGDQTATGASL